EGAPVIPHLASIIITHFAKYFQTGGNFLQSRSNSQRCIGLENLRQNKRVERAIASPFVGAELRAEKNDRSANCNTLEFALVPALIPSGDCEDPTVAAAALRVKSFVPGVDQIPDVFIRVKSAKVQKSFSTLRLSFRVAFAKVRQINPIGDHANLVA